MKNKFLKMLAIAFLALPLIIITGCGPTHEKSSTYGYDDNNHWYICSVAGCEKEDHIYEKAEHNWQINTELSVAPTHFMKGTKIYNCVCGATKEEEYSLANMHEAGSSWSYNSTHHWHNCKNLQCTNKVMNKAAHVYEENAIVKKCTTCGYVVKDENYLINLFRKAINNTLTKQTVTIKKTNKLDNDALVAGATYNFATKEALLNYENKDKQKIVKNGDLYKVYNLTTRKYADVVKSPLEQVALIKYNFVEITKLYSNLNTLVGETNNVDLNSVKELVTKLIKFDNGADTVNITAFEITALEDGKYKLEIVGEARGAWISSDVTGNDIYVRDSRTYIFTENEILEEYNETYRVVDNTKSPNYKFSKDEKITYTYTFDEEWYNEVDVSGFTQQ